ncbi:MAG: glycosyltransferase [Muribaculaceae bacterium]|nr:glycosyltransferase [Muribaculaceae bacterium]
MPFSVLMSLYAKENPAYLRESLDSVFRQTMPADEVVLVEDGPLTPELYAVLDEYGRRFPALKRVALAENGGLGRALNEGLRHCSHDVVARMDTDDVCFPERFEKQVAFMQEHPEVDICSSWIEEFEGSPENVKSVKKVPATHREISRYIKKRSPLNHPAVMFRKKAVVDAGGYRHFWLFEDWYLWARMMAAGAIFANIQESLLHFRTAPGMVRRRGGCRYAASSARLQWTFYKLGIVSLPGALWSSLLRGTVYVLPNRLRAFIYTKFLRS